MVREAVPARYFENQIDSMNQVIAHIGGCLDTIEQGLADERSAAARTPSPMAATPPHPPHPQPLSKEPRTEPALGNKAELYRIASRFARRGSSAEELMSDCGLSRGEAQTIANMQSGAGMKP
jgi:hypothetical protein